MKLKYLFYIISVFLLMSCAANKSMVDTNIVSIEFGYSGGFTNQHTKKMLDDKGCLYNVSGSEKKLLCKVNEEIVINLFKEASQLDGTIRDAGNISYYIIVRSKNGEMKWIWNKSTTNVDSLWALYRKLNDLK